MVGWPQREKAMLVLTVLADLKHFLFAVVTRSRCAAKLCGRSQRIFLGRNTEVELLQRYSIFMPLLGFMTPAQIGVACTSRLLEVGGDFYGGIALLTYVSTIAGLANPGEGTKMTPRNKKFPFPAPPTPPFTFNYASFGFLFILLCFLVRLVFLLNNG